MCMYNLNLFDTTKKNTNVFFACADNVQMCINNWYLLTHKKKNNFFPPAGSVEICITDTFLTQKNTPDKPVLPTYSSNFLSQPYPFLNKKKYVVLKTRK